MTHAATDISPSKTTDEQKFVAVSGLMPKSSCVSALAAGSAALAPTEVTMSVRTDLMEHNGHNVATYRSHRDADAELAASPAHCEVLHTR
jgi:hypothetical protein